MFACRRSSATQGYINSKEPDLSKKDELESLLCGIRTAVAELRDFREMFDEDRTAENQANIRFGEMAVILMAESLVDKTQ